MTGKSTVYRYNMSIYYQSTIVYFVVMILYALIKGEFLEDRFELIIQDPVIYFFIIVVVVSLIALLYNMSLNRHIEVSENTITFRKGKRKRTIKLENILSVKIGRDRKHIKSLAFYIVRLHVKNRKFPIAVRPYDYENSAALLSWFRGLKTQNSSKFNS